MRFIVHSLGRLSESKSNQSWVICDFLWSSLRNHAARLSQRTAQQVATRKSQEKHNLQPIRCPTPFPLTFVASPVLCGHDWATPASFETQSQTHEVRTHQSRVQLSRAVLVVKNPAASAGKGSNPWVKKVPWRRAWQPTLVCLPGKFHGQRNLVGFSPWGRKE